MTRPGPHAIFYFVRESIATTEDLELFRRFKGFIGENLWQRVILVATNDGETDSSVSEHKRVKDTEYISYQMNEEVKHGQTIWLFHDFTVKQLKDMLEEHIKRQATQKVS